jgi:hypothetical protein
MSDKDQLIQATVAVYDLKQRRQNGASTFTWIAGLSVVNSVMMLNNGNLILLGGLGVTQLITAVGMIAQQETQSQSIAGAALVVSILVALVFYFLGKMAHKGHDWAFVAGMVLYSFDALPLLFFGDWLNLAFHAWFLLGIWGGLQASKQLRAFMTAPPAEPGFTPEETVAQ